MHVKSEHRMTERGSGFQCGQTAQAVHSPVATQLQLGVNEKVEFTEGSRPDDRLIT
jgi:hypothetical protein